jgi:hypothetical protein
LVAIVDFAVPRCLSDRNGVVPISGDLDGDQEEG